MMSVPWLGRGGGREVDMTDCGDMELPREYL